jgi:hypothetical protein
LHTFNTTAFAAVDTSRRAREPGVRPSVEVAMTHKTVNLNVPTLTRVEGEGAMHVSVRDGVVERVELEIYEPPRFFEALLRGRRTPSRSTSRRASAASARSPTR